MNGCPIGETDDGDKDLPFLSAAAFPLQPPIPTSNELNVLVGCTGYDVDITTNIRVERNGCVNEGGNREVTMQLGASQDFESYGRGRSVGLRPVALRYSDSQARMRC